MEKVKVNYPIIADLTERNETHGSRHFILKTVAASLVGASIPAVIFYFLM